jgi:D-serine deaminase-like pyridoxal phosphate-dependent protein
MTIDTATKTVPYRAPLGAGPAEIDTPALLLDHARLIGNIARMATFAAGGPARLRPHSKTHKCVQIARLQLDAGAVGVTCAKLGEAEALIDGGVTDILIANQIVGPIKIARLVGLRRRADVMVAVDDADNVAQLSAAATAAGLELRASVSRACRRMKAICRK